MNSGYMLHIEHEEYAKRIEEEFKRINHRLEELEKQGKNQTELLVTIKELTLEIRDLKKEVISQEERLETLENRDGEKWRKAEWVVISGIIMAIVGYVAGKLGF